VQARGPGLARFRRGDYLGDPRTPLDEAVRALAHQRLGRTPQGPIRLLTTLRTLGHCFNPVSFYYCFAPDGTTLDAVVAEVTNTPWGERHAYVTDGREGVFDKALHVSPFMPMEQRYTWRATTPEDTLKVHIASNDEHGKRAFDATLALDRRPLRLRGLVRLPGLRTLALIYGHAVALKLKGVPVQPHPAR
jgi:DUF1365 family protein